MQTRDRMIQHLISQFQGRPNIEAVLSAVGDELDEIYAVLDDLRTRRWIDTASGKQLDGLGEIVGQDRRIANSVYTLFFGFVGQGGALGFEEGRFRDTWENHMESSELLDDHYKTVIRQKIRKNVFTGTTEQTLQSLQFIFNAPIVITTELGNAKFAIGLGRRLTENDLQLARALNLLVKAAGVGVVWQATFEAGDVFGFQGQPAQGFETGKFADTFDVPNI